MRLLSMKDASLSDCTHMENRNDSLAGDIHINKVTSRM